MKRGKDASGGLADPGFWQVEGVTVHFAVSHFAVSHYLTVTLTLPLESGKRRNRKRRSVKRRNGKTRWEAVSRCRENDAFAYLPTRRYA